MPQPRLRRAATIARREWRLALETALLTVAMRSALGLVSLVRCFDVVGELVRRLPRGRPIDPARAAHVVELVSGHLGRQACLTQTLVLYAVLARRAVDAEVVIGTSADGGRFAAHAWLRTADRQWLSRGSDAFVPLCAIGGVRR